MPRRIPGLSSSSRLGGIYRFHHGRAATSVALDAWRWARQTLRQHFLPATSLLEQRRRDVSDWRGAQSNIGLRLLTSGGVWRLEWVQTSFPLARHSLCIHRNAGQGGLELHRSLVLLRTGACTPRLQDRTSSKAQHFAARIEPRVPGSQRRATGWSGTLQGPAAARSARIKASWIRSMPAGSPAHCQPLIRPWPTGLRWAQNEVGPTKHSGQRYSSLDLPTSQVNSAGCISQAQGGKNRMIRSAGQQGSDRSTAEATRMANHHQAGSLQRQESRPMPCRRRRALH